MLLSEGWLPLPIRFHTPTQLTMYCVFQIHYFEVWWGNSSGKTVLTQLCPKMMRNFNKLVCYYIWKLYYIRTSGIIWTFWIQIYSDYHLNSIYIYYSCFWLVVFCYVLLCISLCVYCKFMCIRMY